VIKDHEHAFAPDVLPKLDVKHFPEAVRERLVKALVSQHELWDDMRLEVIDADSPYLRVTLSVSERLLYLFAPEDGKELSFQAPIMVDFPEQASHFVLTNNGYSPYANFAVGEGLGRKQVEDATGQLVEQHVDVLYDYGKVGFDNFVDEPLHYLLRMVTSMGAAEEKVQEFLDTPPIIQVVA
jgi:hypothetical protein